MRIILTMLVAVGALAATEVLAQAPAADVRKGHKFRSPGEASEVSRPARAQARGSDRRRSLDARAEGRAAALTAFDGSWSVAINTRSGACQPSYRFGVQIINGNVVHEGRSAGRVSANGSVQVVVSSGDQQARGQGHLSRTYGTGIWHGYGSAGTCAGSWQAGRRG